MAIFNMVWGWGWWPSLITTAWIYWNANLWLISFSSNGSTRNTIADKNLGATKVWNYWDTLTPYNTWPVFQRWNNFPFPCEWAVTTSSTQQARWTSDSYCNSTFITVNQWSSNANFADNRSKWPCPDWYHIPTKDELVNLKTVFSSLWWWDTDWANFSKYYKLPKCESRDYYNGAASSWYPYWFYRSCTHLRKAELYFLRFSETYINPQDYHYMWYWHSVRPFKDTSVQPDTSWTKLY